MPYPSNNSRGSYGGGKKFGGGGGGFRDDRPTVMHRAVCEKCNKDCEVPFKPNGRKPVFCSFCFRDEQAGTAAPFERPNFEDRPTSFEKTPYRSTPHGGSEEVVTQLKTLNRKMDQLLNLLQEFMEEGAEGDEDENEDGEEPSFARGELRKGEAKIEELEV